VDRNRNELKVGIAVLASLIILVVAIMWAKGFSLKVRQYDITVIFDNVQGLESGSNVLANGVEKGRVHEIRLSEGRVIVKASIDKDVKLFTDYKVTVESPTLLAGKVLSIYPGHVAPYANTDEILEGSPTLGMTEAVEIAKDLSGDLKMTIQNLNILLVSLEEVVGDSVNQANIAGAVAESRDVARLSGEWLRENRGNLTAVLDRMEATFAAAETLLAVTGPQLSSTMIQVDSTMVQLTAVSASLHRVLGSLEGDQSTAGKLLHDDELYQRLNRVLASMDSLATEVRGRGLKMRHSLKLF
jgi:phospholipid/cholesterol/gamma-HCH transport system substrate-binding protein